MRVYLLAILLASLLTAQVLRAAETPYVAYVRGAKATVRSGPGKVHYGTQQLPTGTKIEVYREDPGGWLAIRPPAGSFSLVPARDLKLTDQPGVASVQSEAIQALVGSVTTNTTQPLWQVRLKKGELVEVVGIVKRKGTPDQAQVPWFKIAPPAGEFRWIHRDSVVTDPSQLLVASASETPSISEGAVKLAPTSDNPKAASTNANEASSGQPESKWGDDFVARSSDRPRAEGTTPATPTTTNTNIVSPSPVVASSPAPNVLSQLSAADVELSLMLAEDPTKWNLTPLKGRIEALSNQATSNLEKGRARLLLNRVAECESIQQRRQAIAKLDTPPARLAPDGITQPSQSRHPCRQARQCIW